MFKFRITILVLFFYFNASFAQTNSSVGGPKCTIKGFYFYKNNKAAWISKKNPTDTAKVFAALEGCEDPKLVLACRLKNELLRYESDWENCQSRFDQSSKTTQISLKEIKWEDISFKYDHEVTLEVRAAYRDTPDKYGPTTASDFYYFPSLVRSVDAQKIKCDCFYSWVFGFDPKSYIDCADYRKLQIDEDKRKLDALKKSLSTTPPSLETVDAAVKKTIDDIAKTAAKEKLNPLAELPEAVLDQIKNKNPSLVYFNWMRDDSETNLIQVESHSGDTRCTFPCTTNTLRANFYPYRYKITPVKPSVDLETFNNLVFDTESGNFKDKLTWKTPLLSLAQCGYKTIWDKQQETIAQLCKDNGSAWFKIAAEGFANGKPTSVETTIEIKSKFYRGEELAPLCKQSASVPVVAAAAPEIKISGANVIYQKLTDPIKLPDNITYALVIDDSTKSFKYVGTRRGIKILDKVGYNEFTVPSDVNSIIVHVIGGGGSNGYVASPRKWDPYDATAGGGGGGYSVFSLMVNPGKTFKKETGDILYVGSGGKPHISNTYSVTDIKGGVRTYEKLKAVDGEKSEFKLAVFSSSVISFGGESAKPKIVDTGGPQDQADPSWATRDGGNGGGTKGNLDNLNGFTRTQNSAGGVGGEYTHLRVKPDWKFVPENPGSHINPPGGKGAGNKGGYGGQGGSGIYIGGGGRGNSIYGAYKEIGYGGKSGGYGFLPSYKYGYGADGAHNNSELKNGENGAIVIEW